MVYIPSMVDGIVYLAIDSLLGKPAIQTGVKLGWAGQTGNTIALNVANQQVGVSGQVPALAAAATNTLVINNTLVTALSLIFLTVSRGTTAPAATANVVAAISALTAGTSFTITVKNVGTTTSLVTDFIVQYLIVN